LTDENSEKHILCAYDYFRRQNLLCTRCNEPLRGPHLTAMGKKYHLEHFSCTECDIVFKQNDSYYEREGKIYCQYHYSLLFAAKCGGCYHAVLKNFVEVKKHGNLEQWHPECYMIYKVNFYKIKKRKEWHGLQSLLRIHDAGYNHIFCLFIFSLFIFYF